MAQSSLPQVNLERWRPHVLAALNAGQSWAAYARLHHLAKHTLYVAYRHMLARGEISAPAKQTKTRKSATPVPTTSAFVPVIVDRSSVSLRCHVQLPNGVRVDIDITPERWASLLASLAALPCSN